MKRVLAMALALLLCLGLLGACSSGNSYTPPATRETRESRTRTRNRDNDDSSEASSSEESSSSEDEDSSSEPEEPSSVSSSSSSSRPAAGGNYTQITFTLTNSTAEDIYWFFLEDPTTGERSDDLFDEEVIILDVGETDVVIANVLVGQPMTIAFRHAYSTGLDEVVIPGVYLEDGQHINIIQDGSNYYIEGANVAEGGGVATAAPPAQAGGGGDYTSAEFTVTNSTRENIYWLYVENPQTGERSDDLFADRIYILDSGETGVVLADILVGQPMNLIFRYRSSVDGSAEHLVTDVILEPGCHIEITQSGSSYGVNYL